MNYNSIYTPLISVIVPIYNRERTLEVCIQSILASKYRKIEVIMVDDGSTDGSRSICQKYANIDPRVVVLYQSNRGVSAARNTGIKMAKGEWVSFIDSDDSVQQDFYQRLVEADIESIDLAMVGRCYCEFDGIKVRPLKLQIHNTKKRTESGIDTIRYLFGEFNPYENGFFLCTDKLFRRSLLLDKKILFQEDITLDEDQLFVLNYLKYAQSFYHDNTPCYQSIQWDPTIRNNGLSTQLRLPEQYIKVQRANYSAFTQLLAIYPDKSLKEYLVNYIMDRPLTRILFRYCLIGNIRKYGYSRLKKFTQEEILPLLEMEKRNSEMIKSRIIAYFDKALFCQPFLLVYIQLIVISNVSYYCPGLIKISKQLHVTMTGIACMISDKRNLE